MSPSSELRAAAAGLRAFPVVAYDIPLARWLDAEAAEMDGANEMEGHPALEVARIINGTQEER